MLFIYVCIYSFAIVYTIELFISWWHHDFHENYEIGNALGYIWKILNFTSSSTRETRTSHLKFMIRNAASLCRSHFADSHFSNLSGGWVYTLLRDLATVQPIINQRHIQMMMFEGLPKTFPQATANACKLQPAPVRYRHCRLLPTTAYYLPTLSPIDAHK